MKQESTIDYEQILLKDPLFTEYPLHSVNEMDLLNLLYFLGDNSTYNHLNIIDSYCPICKKDTTFNSEQSDQQELSDLIDDAGMYNGFPGEKREITLIEELEKRCVFIRKFNCPRKPHDSAHSQIFIFRVIGTTLIKIGQHPTLADLSKQDLKKYRKLNDNIYTELNRAVGLSTHGVGIGSFVYLRRIIEKHIVYPKIQELIAEGSVTNEQISKSDFKEKIKLSKDKLPSFLVENTKIYSILSKGIHELEEEECKSYFPILRTAIEIVLEEEIEQKEKVKKNKLISDQLNKFK
tara:strand:+ start:120 stop:998 length:879 start_codon:yes stop_codon:yes gene_type:complete